MPPAPSSLNITAIHKLCLPKPVWPSPKSFQEWVVYHVQQTNRISGSILRAISKNQWLLPTSDIKVECYSSITYARIYYDWTQLSQVDGLVTWKQLDLVFLFPCPSFTRQFLSSFLLSFLPFHIQIISALQNSEDSLFLVYFSDIFPSPMQ